MSTLEVTPATLEPEVDPTEIERPHPLKGKLRSGAPMAAVLLFPAALTVALSFNSGAFFPGTTALATVIVSACAAICLIFVRRPFEGVNRSALVIGGALALFAGWTLLSAHWSHAPGRALLSYDRVMVYVLTFAIFASIGRSAGRTRMLFYGIASACAFVSIAALISRTLPRILPPDLSFDPERLSYPLTYWNTMGLIAGIGLILCGHLASSDREPRAARILGAAACPLLATTLFLTFSRGATWATLMGVLAYLIIARPRGALLAGLSTLPPWAVALVAVNPPSSLTKSPYAPATLANGRKDAAILLGCAVAAGALRAALLPLDDRLARIYIPPRTRKRLILGIVLVLGVGLLGLVGSGAISNTLDRKIAQFQHGGISNGGLNRLFSASSNGRTDLWRVALDTFHANPLHGTGAGTYEVDWYQHRHGSMTVVNAHSLYLETMAELGWVGILLLAVALIGILVALARLARGRQRPFYAALFSAVLAWALAASVDWDWQMPAVTLWVFAVGGLAVAAPLARSLPLARVRQWLRFPAIAACLVLAIAPLGVVAAEAHINRAVRAAQNDNCQTAQAEAAKARADVSSFSSPAIIIAYCDIAAGQPAAAIQPLRQAIPADPNDWQLWYDLGVVLVQARHDAEAAVLTADRLNPHDSDVQKLVSAASASGPGAAKQIRELAARRARDLRAQAALGALVQRTPAQQRRLVELEAVTAREAGEIGNLRLSRQTAPSQLTPVLP